VFWSLKVAYLGVFEGAAGLAEFGEGLCGDLEI